MLNLDHQHPHKTPGGRGGSPVNSTLWRQTEAAQKKVASKVSVSSGLSERLYPVHTPENNGGKDLFHTCEHTSAHIHTCAHT